MQHEVSREGALASRGGSGAATRGRVTQDAGSRQDDSFSVEETRGPSQLARENCCGRAGPSAVGLGSPASPGVPWGRREAARPGLGTETQLQVDMWVQRE